jgi:hypothetical protein
LLRRLQNELFRGRGTFLRGLSDQQPKEVDSSSGAKKSQNCRDRRKKSAKRLPVAGSDLVDHLSTAICRRILKRSRRITVQDVVYVAALLVFFVLATLFVMACDKIIGPDEDALAEAEGGVPAPEPLEEEQAAA